MDNKEWLSKLKVGDEVIVSRWNQPDRLEKVTKRTPSGRLTVGGLDYNSDGSIRGGDRYARASLAEATQERRDKAEDYALTQHLFSLKWHAVSLETKRAIDALLKGE